MVIDTDIDQGLLFAVIALQNHFIDDADLIAGFHEWAAEKSRSYDQVLVDRGTITKDEHALVDALVTKHLKKHGDDTLGALGKVADSAVRDVLRALDHPAARQTLSSLPPAASYVQTQTLMAPTDAKRARYKLNHVHAQGGLGRVWLAHDTDLNRQVALKEIQPSVAADVNIGRRFLREAQVTGQLEHPGIVPVYELARRPEDDQPFYTMQFVHGKTMREAIAEYQGRRTPRSPHTLDLHKLLHAFISICQTIAYAHSRGVIHRDLKPENIVLGGFGEVLVLDWGLARMIDRDEADDAQPPVNISNEAEPEATHAGECLGTPAYMAPEQAEGRLDLIDNRTDIYGLGSILFEVLTGRPPHRAANLPDLLRQVAEGATPRVREVDPSIPPALDAICARAMAKERSGRYAKAAKLADDVQRWLADERVSAYQEPPTGRLRRFAKHHRQTLQIATVVVVAAVVSIYSLVRAAHEQRIVRLAWEIEQRIEYGNWSPDALRALETKAASLEQLDRLQGLEARRKIHQAYTRKINDQLDHSPRLEPAQIAQIQGDISALGKYTPELARTLRKNLELRLKASRRSPDLGQR